MLAFFLLCLGLVGLWFGTELTVRAALRIAEARGLSQAFIGLTILAIGTDVPEIVMSVMAAIGKLNGTDASGVVIGSAVGSCLGQIGLVLGLAGLAGYLSLSRHRIWNDGVMLLGSVLLLGLVAIDGQITGVEGAILLTVYGVYAITLVRREHRSDKLPIESRRKRIDAAQCALGLALVAGFAHLVLSQSLHLAVTWGLGQTLVGLLMVGVGTSLPELALSITAVRKKAGALSVGNIVGSNIFDLLIPPGVAAMIAGVNIPSPGLLSRDLLALFILSFAALFFFTKKKGLQRWEAATLLLAYIAYITVRLFMT